ncbi:mammalian cell entry protein [Mycolicibacterium moriokaense]|nr:MCE family protein [Mycolicibacterium moriokaense]MCV7041960.1 MCE family protein [Mycolicibacterium moriokaense]ORB25224.1 mammalian cell entry protein [Mycolicibacterium moriokaense]
MSNNARNVLAVVLVVLTAGGFVVAQRCAGIAARSHLVAYFDNSNGLFTGDEVLVLGVPVGEIDRIEPQPDRVKVSFWVDGSVKVPAEARAVILSPQLVTSRAIQLTPAYAGGPVMAPGSVIPLHRTAVPIEWDDLRVQLEKLTETLQPTHPGGVSTLGAFINTAADNVRGQGANIRDTLIKMSQMFSTFGDHSGDIFATIKNLSILVSALQDSTTLLKQLNQNLAGVTALLANDPDEVGAAIRDLNTAVGDVQSFVAEHREALGTTTDKLSSISRSVYDSLDDIKQTLHLAPTAFQNLLNIFQPAQAALTGALVVNNFANPITFLCGAIQAASRLGAEQAAKLCVQYLAPIIKNRQYNFPPIGLNPFVGTHARPNEITYSEDWMRPDYVPPAAAAADLAVPVVTAESAAPASPPPAPPVATDPSAGLAGIMVPAAGGS